LKYSNSFIVFLFLSIAFSCVSKKKLTEAQVRAATTISGLERNISQLKSQLAESEKQNVDLRSDLKTKQGEITNANSQLKLTTEQLDYLKKTNTNLLDRLSDLSVVNKTGAENMKKTLDALNEQSKYIKDLNGKIQSKDSANMSLVVNLKRSLNNINDDDVKVEVKKGVVYISISDKLLFSSGSAEVNLAAETVLEKVAKVLNDHTELDILVEGHTDNQEIANDCVKDNWDLSAKRATAVVRLLQKKFSVSPERMTAGGRSEYVPKSQNTTDLGKQENRRTEIIAMPRLDQFFQLLAPQK
jgi:chemotaxis protein MotB